MAREPTIVLLLSLAVGVIGATPTVRPDAFPSYLRVADCGLAMRDASRWHADRRLGQAAALWARGSDLNAAVEHSGYTASAVAGLHVDDINAPRRAPPGTATCHVLRNRSLLEVGIFENRYEAWIVFAAPITLPDSGDEARVALHALELVNRARQSHRQCGTRTVPAANPLRLSAQLSEAAAQHALDMSKHHYFEHQDPDGRTPADRVRATGYAERRVGENIAYGVLSTESAIAGWLRSPGHCENLMDPNFQEMGIAFAREQGGHAELYWVQVLAAPQQLRRSGRFAPPSLNH